MRYLAVVILLALAVHSFGQDRPSSRYENRKLLIGPYATLASIENFSSKFGIGVSYEYFLGRNFSFGGVLAGGSDYAEFSGAIFGLMGLAELQSTRGVGFFLFIPLVFENPCIHFEPARNHNFGLSFNFMKFRYIFEESKYYGEQYLFASGSVTLRYTLFGESNWQCSFLAEGTVLYNSGSPKGLQFGVAMRHLSRNPMRHR